MQWRNQRLYGIDLSEGENEEQLLTAMVMAVFALAEPLDGKTPDGAKLSAAEAREYVSDRGISMLFVKGRMCTTDIKVVNSGMRRVLLKFDMYDGDIDRLLLLASDILDRLVTEQTIELGIEDLIIEDDGVVIEVDLDLSDIGTSGARVA